MLTLAVAVGVNTASVALQARCGLFTSRFGRRGLEAHLAVTLPGWLAFLALLPRAGAPTEWPLPAQSKPLGRPLQVASGLLWLAAFRQLGPVRTANGYFFGRGPRARASGGVYRHLSNPMYAAYVLALVGTAFRTANAAYLPLAAEAAMLFSIEARIENRPFRKREVTPR
jgi:protein-S-isoprenylcysteine O-methyltransferase Ste14